MVVIHANSLCSHMFEGGGVMEDIPKCRKRGLCRTFERHRCEDQLWDLAYEVLWPQIRKALTRHVPERSSDRPSKTASQFETVKGA